MWLINLAISLFSILKVYTLECLSIINRECMPRPKILDVNEGVGEVCNSKQIWNSDTCKCDCHEDFAGTMTCNKGYMWHPSTCACECDVWCKPGQYLDYNKCICKHKLIGNVISECTSLVNESMMNNKISITNDDTTKNIFIGLFSVLMFAGITCFCVFAYFKCIKGKKLFGKRFENKHFNDVSKIHGDY